MQLSCDGGYFGSVAIDGEDMEIQLVNIKGDFVSIQRHLKNVQNKSVLRLNCFAVDL